MNSNKGRGNPPTLSRRDLFTVLMGRSPCCGADRPDHGCAVGPQLAAEGTLLALYTLDETWHGVVTEGVGRQSGRLAADVLEEMGTLLKAGVFSRMGMGREAVFIRPLNLASALNVESLPVLEHQVILVRLGATFPSRFVR